MANPVSINDKIHVTSKLKHKQDLNMVFFISTFVLLPRTSDAGDGELNQTRTAYTVHILVRLCSSCVKI